MGQKLKPLILRGFQTLKTFVKMLKKTIILILLILIIPLTTAITEIIAEKPEQRFTLTKDDYLIILAVITVLILALGSLLIMLDIYRKEKPKEINTYENISLEQ